MRKVAILGAAMNRFGRYPEKSIQDLGWPIVKAAVNDAGVAPKDIQAAYAGSAYGGRLVGQRVLRPLGMLGLPVVNCENACSSGGTAFREAWHAIATGQWDCALVIGIDKLTALGGGARPIASTTRTKRFPKRSAARTVRDGDSSAAPSPPRIRTSATSSCCRSRATCPAGARASCMKPRRTSSAAISPRTKSTMLARRP